MSERTHVRGRGPRGRRLDTALPPPVGRGRAGPLRQGEGRRPGPDPGAEGVPLVPAAPMAVDRVRHDHVAEPRVLAAARDADEEQHRRAQPGHRPLGRRAAANSSPGPAGCTPTVSAPRSP
ncbi:hypothetical protein [Streptomyces sp. NPDC008240]|uniref:hypothetical protein n=1 Tax=Streptomyces sp. NPDC008240 TaxID=3364822 RepID=UPI0036E165E6